MGIAMAQPRKQHSAPSNAQVAPQAVKAANTVDERAGHYEEGRRMFPTAEEHVERCMAFSEVASTANG
jgi:hypothetical protein